MFEPRMKSMRCKFGVVQHSLESWLLHFHLWVCCKVFADLGNLKHTHIPSSALWPTSAESFDGWFSVSRYLNTTKCLNQVM